MGGGCWAAEGSKGLFCGEMRLALSGLGKEQCNFAAC